MMDSYFLFEEGVVFDQDDPDFDGEEQTSSSCESSVCRHQCSTADCIDVDQSAENMSCGVIQSGSYGGCHNSCNQWLERSESRQRLDRRFDSLWSSDSETDLPEEAPQDDHKPDVHPQKDELLRLEELGLEFNSCYTCGVSWSEDQVSLDCRECGGYASSRPCPKCDGKCQAEWSRNVEASHTLRKAQWDGKCDLAKDEQSPTPQFSPQDHLIQDFESLSTS